jgi:HD-GYP domain-containing protein (c-di-GMP phosphodiesterase class II)
MPQIYGAHSDREGLSPDDPKAHWQRLSEHLVQVSSLCKKLAELAKPGDTAFADSARVIGLLHDLGKYQTGFSKLYSRKREINPAFRARCGVRSWDEFGA